MPRLQCFELKATTGERGMAKPPQFVINGFALDFDQTDGGVQPGETFTAKGSPDSFPHSLHLTGPAQGAWDIAALEITYYPYGEEPYTLHFASVTLDEQSDLNIWHAHPEQVMDV